jgi:5'-nucleotidase
LRILLTNDDGVFARGFQALETIARALSDDLWFVAPDVERSGASRALTLTDPIRVRQLDERRFACSGTPTDCVLLGVLELIEGAKPDLILSGVNRGQNVAEDVSLSGTVAGAMQGMHMGIPSLALSQAYGFRGGAPVPWETAEAYGPDLIRTLLKAGWPASAVLNINFPDTLPGAVAGVEATVQGFRDEAVLHADKRTDLRGGDYYWLGFRGERSDPPAGTDLRALYEGRISVTPLHIDLTRHDAVDALRQGLQG